jgi:hypothetical protein
MTAQAEFHRRMRRLREAQWRHEDRMRRKYGTAAANAVNPGNYRKPWRSRHAPIYVHLALILALVVAACFASAR